MVTLDSVVTQVIKWVFGPLPCNICLHGKNLALRNDAESTDLVSGTHQGDKDGVSQLSLIHMEKIKQHRHCDHWENYRNKDHYMHLVFQGEDMEIKP